MLPHPGGGSAYHDVFGEGFKSFPIWLYHRDRYVTGFPGFYICDGAGFACMYTTRDIALNAISKFYRRFGFHFIMLNSMIRLTTHEHCWMGIQQEC